MQEDKVIWTALYGVIIGGVLLGAYLSKPFYILSPGFTAIHMRLGKIINVQREGGIYFMIPLVDTIFEMPNGIRKGSIETSALSKDLQAISIGIDVNYRYINEIELYKATRGKAEELILFPFCHESIKAIISQYTAEELILNRHEAKEKIYRDLKERLRPHYIEFIEVNFAHADFSHDFIKAVEEKQIAHQHAMMAKNLTEQVREKAFQLKLKADAEAYEQQVKKQSLTPDMVQLRAIEKWDGKLPTVMTGSVPFIDITKHQ
jgi:regulator of protease activity HflC (stomatin/prohibitin superfamily)